MTLTKTLSPVSASLTRTTAFLVTDKPQGYLVVDAACIIPVPLEEAVVSARIEHGTAPVSRMERSAANPRRLAALRRARTRIAAALAEDESMNLPRLRLQAGLSQADVANMMGTQQPAIARLERGEGDPKLSTLSHLAGALNVDVGVVIHAFEAARSQQAHES